MFRGYNRPNRQNIFGPSISKMRGSGFSFADDRQDPLFMRGEGFSFADSRHDPLMMHGEGLGSMFGSIFRRIMPAMTGIAKKVASSKALKEVGKQVLDSGVNALANTAANAIAGDKTAGEAAADELQNARKEIGDAIRSANAKRNDVTPTKRKKKKIGNKSFNKRKRVRKSVFDDDDY